MWPRVIAFEHKILIAESEEVLHVGVELHTRQGARSACQLQLGLLDMVEIKMRVAGGMDEVAGFETRDLGHHLQQQGIGGNVEGHPKERIGRALIELQRQSAVGYVELEETMARGKCHLVDFGYIPSRNNHTP